HPPGERGSPVGRYAQGRRRARGARGRRRRRQRRLGPAPRRRDGGSRRGGGGGPRPHAHAGRRSPPPPGPPQLRTPNPPRPPTAAAAVARTAGVSPEKIAVDPGLGFGKSPEGNLALLRHLAAFRTLGFPVAVGASRKGFVRRFSGVAEDASAADRLPGSLAAV